MKNRPPDFTLEYLRSVLKYVNGELYWIAPAQGRSLTLPAGSASGYHKIVIDGRQYHRSLLVWFMHTEEWPISDMIVDHRNGNRLDDRFENLRLVPQSVNRANSKCRNLIGFKGVSPINDGRFAAQITIKGKTVRLGVFETALEASVAFDKRHVEEYGEFSHVARPKAQDDLLEKEAFLAGWIARGSACYPDPSDGELEEAWRTYQSEQKGIQ